MKKRNMSATIGLVIGAFIMRSFIAVIVMILIFMFIGRFIKK